VSVGLAAAAFLACTKTCRASRHLKSAGNITLYASSLAAGLGGWPWELPAYASFAPALKGSSPACKEVHEACVGRTAGQCRASGACGVAREFPASASINPHGKQLARGSTGSADATD
jgi:hypothetical protein